MKKVVFCAVALFVGGMTYSQVTDGDGNSSPNAHVVTPPIGSAPGANVGKSIQNGNDNKVRVRQIGTSQSAYTVQDDGTTGVGGNQADVWQSGNVSSASGVENKADVRQSGEANSSYTRQEGDYNEAVTRQGQNNPAGKNNKAKIRQGTGQNAEGNYAAIDQDGDDNWAQTQQTFDNSDAWTQQTGNENKSKIVQNAGPNHTDGHYAMNQQKGDENESYIDQKGNGARNAARTYQLGDNQQAQQHQTATASTGGVGNDAGIQQGSDSAVYIVAPVTYTQWGSIYNNVDPIGGMSFSGPTEFNQALQVQVGDANSAGIFQAGGHNYGEQNQNGNGNVGGMIQVHAYNQDPNYARQDQKGDSNDAGLIQEGGGHKSLQVQDGNSNISWASQMGVGHKLNTHQFGNSNVAYSGQHGLNNSALVVQYDGQSYSVEQNMNLGQYDTSAGGNQANILQMGPGGDVVAGAVNCAFDNPKDLDMDYDFPGVSLDNICPGC